jgi:hypothetical protein
MHTTVPVRCRPRLHMTIIGWFAGLRIMSLFQPRIRQKIETLKRKGASGDRKWKKSVQGLKDDLFGQRIPSVGGIDDAEVVQLYFLIVQEVETVRSL